MITSHDYDLEPPFLIEIKEFYNWETVDCVDDFHDALLLASSYCKTYREDRIQIIDNNGKVI
jgi:hypothetical protein